jgi:hypothetical protein
MKSKLQMAVEEALECIKTRLGLINPDSCYDGYEQTIARTKVHELKYARDLIMVALAGEDE